MLLLLLLFVKRDRRSKINKPIKPIRVAQFVYKSLIKKELNPFFTFFEAWIPILDSWFLQQQKTHKILIVFDVESDCNDPSATRRKKTRTLERKRREPRRHWRRCSSISEVGRHRHVRPSGHQKQKYLRKWKSLVNLFCLSWIKYNKTTKNRLNAVESYLIDYLTDPLLDLPVDSSQLALTISHDYDLKLAESLLNELLLKLANSYKLIE